MVINWLRSPRNIWLTISPRLGLVVGESDGYQEHSRPADEEEKTDQIQLPEQGHCTLLPGQAIDDGNILNFFLFLDVRDLAGSGASSEHSDDRDGKDRSDDGEHAWKTGRILSSTRNFATDCLTDSPSPSTLGQD